MTASSPLVLGATLLGGIGLFLLGMTMLTDGLKVAAGRALERILAAWTRTRLHGLVMGVLLTALVQSSTALTVAAIGFVNAGLLSFTSALWVVFGSNLGSSVTGWLVAAIGFNFKIDAFALPFIGVGMALQLTGAGTRRGALGTSLAGFGVLFLGIDLLKDGFDGLGPQALPPLGTDVTSLVLAALVGLLTTIVLQASSATLTLVLTAVAGGLLPVEAGAAMVIGANVGTTLTGILAAIGATSNARRLAAAHVLFNVVTAVVAMALLVPLLRLLHALGVWLTGSSDVVTQLVLFHTSFNLLGVLLMWPLSGPLVRFLLARFRSAEDDDARARYLDHNVAAVPELALQALRRELAHLGHCALRLAADAARLNPLTLPWAPASAQSDTRLARQLQTVELLQDQIGAFVGDMSRQPMPQDVANQLPDLLRIATYFDTLARVMHHVGQQAVHALRPPEPARPHPPWAPAPQDAGTHGVLHQCVAPVFAAALDFFSSDSADGPWLAEEARNAFEDRYQTAKAALLQAGAGGTVDVAAAVDWLAQISDLRRAVEQGYKAGQHLATLPQLAPEK
ncbi:MAG TPA: Na/Pi symporter [Acidovorax sp.]|jgi:phosphate:Na+ symporter|nr:Na/Pi symporter [Acidovorax sp.]